VFERYDLLHKYVSSASCDLSTLTWSEPLDISPPSPVNAENAGFPVLAINERGDGVAVWKEYDGKTMVIQGAGYSLGSWSYVKTLSEIGSHAGDLMATYDMDVAINEAGQIMAVWPEDPT